MAITVNGADQGMYEIRWIEISLHSTLHAQNKYSGPSSYWRFFLDLYGKEEPIPGKGPFLSYKSTNKKTSIRTRFTLRVFLFLTMSSLVWLWVAGIGTRKENRTLVGSVLPNCGNFLHHFLNFIWKLPTCSMIRGCMRQSIVAELIRSIKFWRMRNRCRNSFLRRLQLGFNYLLLKCYAHHLIFKDTLGNRKHDAKILLINHKVRDNQISLAAQYNLPYYLFDNQLFNVIHHLSKLPLLRPRFS